LLAAASVKLMASLVASAVVMILYLFSLVPGASGGNVVSRKYAITENFSQVFPLGYSVKS
jgi:hypothetical protein